VWAALSSDEAEYEWLRLNEWVEDLRRSFYLPAQIIPPFWHRHPVLVEHLSALHTHWLTAFDPEQPGSAPFAWIRDLDEWKNRMREQVAMLGTRLDADRPARIAAWPGEPAPNPEDTAPPVNLADRYEDFVTHLLWWVDRRKALEDRYYKLIAEDDDNTLPARLPHPPEDANRPDRPQQRPGRLAPGAGRPAGRGRPRVPGWRSRTPPHHRRGNGPGHAASHSPAQTPNSASAPTSRPGCPTDPTTPQSSSRADQCSFQLPRIRGRPERLPGNKVQHPHQHHG
jgi:hypothetical protein